MKNNLLIGAVLIPLISLAAHKSARKVPCDENRTHEIRIPRARVTVLNFPVKPKEIVPGENVFDFKHIKNDLAIKALTSQAHTNIFVYLDNRRCAFNFITVPNAGDEIVLIRDEHDNEVEVNYRD